MTAYFESMVRFRKPEGWPENPSENDIPNTVLHTFDRVHRHNNPGKNYEIFHHGPVDGIPDYYEARSRSELV